MVAQQAIHCIGLFCSVMVSILILVTTCRGFLLTLNLVTSVKSSWFLFS
jgi:hypothetical protein